MGKSPLLWLRLAAAIIDLSCIYATATLLRALLWQFTYIDFGLIFIGSFTLFYLAGYLLFKGYTPGRYLAGLQVLATGGGKPRPWQWLLREILCKALAGLFFPAFIFPYLFPIWSPLLTAACYVIILLLSVICLWVFKTCWWEKVSGTLSVKTDQPQVSGKTLLFFGLTLLLAAALLIIAGPFYQDTSKLRTTYQPRYPNTSETGRYAAFIRQSGKDPVDYVFDLFDHYDLVVLSERYHEEYTQYELIFKIIRDPRFAATVGNIFTETGSVSFQDTLNSFLHADFNTEDELNRGAGHLQRSSNGIWPLWECTNHFDLLKTVHQLDASLPDSSRINWYYSDIPVNWETTTRENYRLGLNPYKRDSIMAENIIRSYSGIISRQRRKKALVIMNTNHGYGLLNGKPASGIKWLDSSTTNYLRRRYPDRVANVMINAPTFLFMPVQRGKWETAFRQSGREASGFNFAQSPFGNDDWDSFIFNSHTLRYQDIFTGLIYYLPLEKHLRKGGYPYELDNFEDSLLRRASCLDNNTLANIRRTIANYHRDPNTVYYTEPAPYALLNNILQVILLPVLMVLAYLLALGLFIRNFWK